MKKILLLSLTLVIGFSAIAQEKFTEGKILMSQTVTTENEQMKEVLDQMFGGKPMQTVTYIKGEKSRSEINNPMSGDITTISDNQKKQLLMLMDSPMLGKKYTLNSISKEDEEKIIEDITIVEGTKTKTILGYTCKEQIITLDQNGVKMEMIMYTTDKIIPVVTQQTVVLAGQLKGFPMYMIMSINQQGMDMVITSEVTELIKETVSDDKFSLTPPEGYEKL